MNKTRFIQPHVRGIPLATAIRLLAPWSLASQRGLSPAPTQHVFLCVADHFEPYWADASRRLAHERVARWVRDYPVVVDGLRDSLGRVPQHTFFYPADQYDPDVLDQLGQLVRNGFGDVEVHLHHDHDSSQGFRDKIMSFAQALSQRHGLLRRDAAGRIAYGFIHGNWALDNARPDGRWCGVNDEISILKQTGCYADFTLPCAPEPGQTSMVNSIYYAIDDPKLPKSHDRGPRSRLGCDGPADGLLMIQGPLGWNWMRRKWQVIPRLENGDLHGANVPTWSRFRLWQRIGVSVQGRPDWVFIKLHTHGSIECNTALFLDGTWRSFHQQLAQRCQSDRQLRYYYVTAHELAGLVHQAEQGISEPDLEAVRAGGAGR
jgi:hypothetical protein